MRGVEADFQRPFGTHPLLVCGVSLSGGSRCIAARFRFITGHHASGKEIPPVNSPGMHH